MLAALLLVASWADLLGQSEALLAGLSSPSSATGSYSRWKSTEVKDQAAELPRLRERPACETSPATGTCLPAFMVIGAQKSGTSSLWNILKTHPQMKLAWVKEVLWFNQDTDSDLETLRCDPPGTTPSDEDFAQYLRAFPKLRMGTSKITGEFSANNLHCWCCPESMKRLMPDLRLVVILRDPIERARSRWKEQHDWAHRYRPRQTYGSFEEYVEHRLPLLQACLKEAGDSLEDQVHCAVHSNVLGLSLYDAPIGLWHRHFQPADFLVTYTEELAASPQSVLTAIHRHLGVNDTAYSEDQLNTKWNARGSYGWDKHQLRAERSDVERSEDERSEETRSDALEGLYEFYRPHMQKLKTMADAGLISRLPLSWVARWNL